LLTIERNPPFSRLLPVLLVWVMNRHDNMRDALCRELRRFPQVQATIEPRVENPQGAADQRRGDIKVHKDGTTLVLDVV
jgi:hypothetical protein